MQRLVDVVARRTGTTCSHDPDHQTGHGRARGGRGRAASFSVAGSRRVRRSPRSSRSSPSSSAPPMPAPSRTARRRLHLALLAVGVEPGDEVITVSHSYIATANAVRYCGADAGVRRHRSGDLQHRSGRRSRRRSRRRTRAILCVHQIGHAVRPRRDPGHRARARSSASIEDAACAIGSEISIDGQWEKIGRPHGDIACFSFHPRKVMSTGDGGMLTTDNPNGTREFRLLRQHGMSVPDTVRHGAAQVIFESYPDARLQLPHDRHPGRGRARTAEAPAGDHRRPPRAGGALHRAAAGQSRHRRAARAGLGAQQLAELLRPAAGPPAISAR